LAYQKNYGADFGITRKQNFWSRVPDRVTLFDLSGDVGGVSRRQAGAILIYPLVARH
jgi:hypothetical protein